MKLTFNRFIIVLFAMLIQSAMLCGQEAQKPDFDPSFVHAVYFWLNNPENEADRKAFEKALYTLLENSEFTKTNYLGTPPEAIRDVVDDSFTYCLIVTFENEESQEAYQVEPAHLKFIEDAGHLWNKVVVYDALGQSN